MVASFVFQLIVIGSLLIVQIVELDLLFAIIKSRGCKIVCLVVNLNIFL